MTEHGWRRIRGAWIAMLAASWFVISTVAAFADDVTVTIDNFTFKPNLLTIKPGTTITFINHDDIPHSIVDSGGAFRSKVLDTEESFKMTVDRNGDFTYFCGLHPHMTGRIVVQP